MAFSIPASFLFPKGGPDSALLCAAEKREVCGSEDVDPADNLSASGGASGC